MNPAPQKTAKIMPVLPQTLRKDCARGLHLRVVTSDAIENDVETKHQSKPLGVPISLHVTKRECVAPVLDDCAKDCNVHALCCGNYHTPDATESQPPDHQVASSTRVADLPCSTRVQSRKGYNLTDAILP